MVAKWPKCVSVSSRVSNHFEVGSKRFEVAGASKRIRRLRRPFELLQMPSRLQGCYRGYGSDVYAAIIIAMLRPHRCSQVFQAGRTGRQSVSSNAARSSAGHMRFKIEGFRGFGGQCRRVEISFPRWVPLVRCRPLRPGTGKASVSERPISHVD